MSGLESNILLLNPDKGTQELTSSKTDRNKISLRIYILVVFSAFVDPIFNLIYLNCAEWA